MIQRVFLIVCLCCLAGASMAQQIGADDVIDMDTGRQVADCLQNTAETDALTCFDRPGVTDGARHLAQALAEGSRLGMHGVLTGFQAVGPVDVAMVFFPTLANTNEQIVLVNGADGPRMAVDLMAGPNAPRTPDNSAMMDRYPNAFESGRVTVAALRRLPDGGQRFVLRDIVTDGCRACPPVAVALRHVDFGNGRLAGIRDIGWYPLAVFDPQLRRQRLQANDRRMLQQALNAQGYDAGAVDGQVGPRTRGALADFQRAHCLPVSPRVTAQVAAALADALSSLDPPPCAPEAGGAPGDDAVALPVRDGVYAAMPEGCPGQDGRSRSRNAEIAADMRVTLQDGQFRQMTQACPIVAYVQADGQGRLSMDCLYGDTPVLYNFVITPLTRDSFERNGQVYRRCEGS